MLYHHRRRGLHQARRASEGCFSVGAAYDAHVSTQPVEQDDSLDPEGILRELPEWERGKFLAAYREAVDGAHDPAGWKNLIRVLRMWHGRVNVIDPSGFHERQEAALYRQPLAMLCRHRG